MDQIHLAFEVEPLQLNGSSPDQSVTWAGLYSANFIVLGEKNATVCGALICCFLNQLLPGILIKKISIKLHFKIRQKNLTNSKQHANSKSSRSNSKWKIAIIQIVRFHKEPQLT